MQQLATVIQQLATKDFWTQHLVHIALYLLIKILTKNKIYMKPIFKYSFCIFFLFFSSFKYK